MAAMDWNDLRHFLAVAESGSTLAAGRTLGVSQTTVARRIAALEDDLGLRLFERRQAGYRLTEAGAALVEPAGEMAHAAATLTDAAASQVRGLAGTVRLTASRIHAETILQPILRELHRVHPAIMVEVDTTDTMRDLASGAADIAIRSCVTPEGGGLVGRRIADEVWGIYASRGYADEHGLPKGRADLKHHEFVGGGGAAVWRVYGDWLEREGLSDRVAMHQGASTGLLAAVRAGVGLAVLPCIVAEHDPALVRCLPVGDGPGRELWLLTHERLRHAPRVRAVMALLGERLAALARAIPQRKLVARPLTMPSRPPG